MVNHRPCSCNTERLLDRRSFIANGCLLKLATSLPSPVSSTETKSPCERPDMNEKLNLPLTSIHRIEADGVKVFYREAGQVDAPVVLLLHGFPTSSFQYRELIPLLADKYRVVAPDLPGFGFTEVPAERGYTYTFDALARTILAFTHALKLTS